MFCDKLTSKKSEGSRNTYIPFFNLWTFVIFLSMQDAIELD